MITWQFWIMVLLIYVCIYMITDSFKYYCAAKYGCKCIHDDWEEEE